MSNSYPVKGKLHPPLPPAPDGLVYWGRTIAVKRPENNSKTEQTYVTTGCFAPDAPDQTVEHLRWVGTLVADFDLADFYVGEVLAADPKGEKALATIKSAFPHLKDSELPKVLLYKVAKKSPEKLNSIRERHLARVRQVVAEVAPDVSPTKIVDSGWGLHVYWWLLVAAADAAAITAARDENRRLVENIDRLAGYELADGGVHDTGTRILRPIGTSNSKDIAGSREVVVVEETDSRWVIGQSRIIEPVNAAPVAAAKATQTAAPTNLPTTLPKSVADVLAASATARDLFDGKGKAATDRDGAPRDTSGSGYDFSLALLLARQGVSVDDAATAIYVRNAGRKDRRHAIRTATKAAAMANSPSSSAPKPPPVFERGDEVEVGLHLLHDLGAVGDDSALSGTLLVTEGGGQWYRVRTDGLWETMSTAPLHVTIQEYAGLPVGEKADPLRVSDRFTKGVMACAAARLDEPGAFERGDLQADPSFAQALAVFADGTVITGDGSVRRCQPDDRVRVTDAIRTLYAPTATCPRFDLFLDEVWAGCPDLDERKAFLGEVLGAAVFGVGTVPGNVPIFIGEGMNGKTRVIGVFDTLFHPSGRTAIPPQALVSEYHRAHLSRSVVNLVSEMPEREIIASEPFKAAVTGDVVPARFPAGRPFDFRPRATWIIACNSLPPTRDTTHGFTRRPVIISFPNTFKGGKADPNLAAKLRAELPGIAAWAVQGGLRLIRTGRYTIPPSSEAAMEQWKTDANNVLKFAAEHLVAVGFAGMRARELYGAYRKWAIGGGYQPVSEARMGRDLAKLYERERDVRGVRWLVQVVEERVEPVEDAALKDIEAALGSNVVPFKVS